MTKPIIAVPTGTQVLFLGARTNCHRDLPQTGTLAVWRADCCDGRRTTITYQSFGTDLDGRLKFILDDAWLLTKGKPTVGRWDGTLTTYSGVAPVRFQLGGTYSLSSATASQGYTQCGPDSCEPMVAALPAGATAPSASVSLLGNDGALLGSGFASPPSSGSVPVLSNDSMTVLWYAAATATVAASTPLLSNDGNTSLGFIAP